MFMQKMSPFPNNFAKNKLMERSNIIIDFNV